MKTVVDNRWVRVNAIWKDDAEKADWYRRMEIVEEAERRTYSRARGGRTVTHNGLIWSEVVKRPDFDEICALVDGKG